MGKIFLVSLFGSTEHTEGGGKKDLSWGENGPGGVHLDLREVGDLFKDVLVSLFYRSPEVGFLRDDLQERKQVILFKFDNPHFDSLEFYLSSICSSVEALVIKS